MARRIPGEYCDDGPKGGTGSTTLNGGNGSSTSACTERCTVNVCGDGVQGLGEQCDDDANNGTSGDGCSSACLQNTCGDGVINTSSSNGGNGPNDSWSQRPEVCDTGTNNGKPTSNCTAQCVLNRCGDGILGLSILTGATTATQEGCDLGDGINNDHGACTTKCQKAVCGDGVIDTAPGAAHELCDDGILLNGTANSQCTINCTVSTCGDGVVNNGEQCDNGSANGTVGNNCTVRCIIDICGDGLVGTPSVGPTEQCDDGNTTSGDGCESNCTKPICGNGFIDPGEQCEIGGDVDAPVTAATPWCTTTCQKQCNAMDTSVTPATKRPQAMFNNGQSCLVLLAPGPNADTCSSIQGYVTMDSLAKQTAVANLLSAQTSLVAPKPWFIAHGATLPPANTWPGNWYPGEAAKYTANTCAVEQNQTDTGSLTGYFWFAASCSNSASTSVCEYVWPSGT